VSVKIRLKKIGRKKQPTYRIVVAESHNPRGGKVVDNLGYYCPYLKTKPLELNLDRVDMWTGKGAIATDAVKRLITRKRQGDVPTIQPKSAKPSAEKKPESIEQTAPEITDTPESATD
jgi:small subunit ribosomal protein S16